MKKHLLYYYYIVSLIIGTIIYSLSKTDIYIPEWARFYVNDFLITPIVLTSSLYCIRILKNDRKYRLPVLIIVYVCGLYSILFECVLPAFHSRYTTDCIDISLYFVGGWGFYRLQKSDID
ncbi:conserved membrane hypothetical protein [Tenacibaculum maritimum]|uniref:hypothetical protein n=1 Tax=Tenacibaculum maritimum TaxID=107401 RepID=UPI0012E4252A|nr:hypothetical protein [Tenacibaculum maritimum]CAA0247262.1 conserved membrane hypothetical protein [Tenacibaculum maritimum]